MKKTKEKPAPASGTVFVDLSSIKTTLQFDHEDGGLNYDGTTQPFVHASLFCDYNADIAAILKSVQRTGSEVVIIGKRFVFKGVGQIHGSVMKPNERYRDPNMTVTVRCSEYLLTYGEAAVRKYKIDNLLGGD